MEKTIGERLNKIQTSLKAPKGQFNDFGKYKYRSCEDILEAVKPLLDGARLVSNDELVLIGDRYYVKATVTLSHGQESIGATAYAREALTKKGMDESQITGTASSYARKYAANGLFCIDDTKDADTMPPDKPESAQNATKPAEATTTSTEHDQRVKLSDMLLEMCDGDREVFKYQLERITKFKGRDGPVPGVDSTTKLKGKRLEVTLSIIQRNYDDFKNPPEQVDVPAKEAI